MNQRAEIDCEKMPNTKQAEKMVRKNAKRTKYNKAWKEKIKSAVKELDKVLAQTSPEPKELENKYKKLQVTVDKAAIRSVIHNNKGNRIKSRMKGKVKQKSAGS